MRTSGPFLPSGRRLASTGQVRPSTGVSDLNQAIVQPGDYLFLNYGGPNNTQLHVIGTPYPSPAGPPTLPAPPWTGTLGSPPPSPVWVNTAVDGSTWVSLQYSADPTIGAPTSWTILRQPRLLQGEEIKQLGGDLVIDFNTQEEFERVAGMIRG